MRVPCRDYGRVRPSLLVLMQITTCALDESIHVEDDNMAIRHEWLLVQQSMHFALRSLPLVTIPKPDIWLRGQIG